MLMKTSDFQGLSALPLHVWLKLSAAHSAEDFERKNFFDVLFNVKFSAFSRDLWFSGEERSSQDIVSLTRLISLAVSALLASFESFSRHSPALLLRTMVLLGFGTVLGHSKLKFKNGKLFPTRIGWKNEKNFQHSSRSLIGWISISTFFNSLFPWMAAVIEKLPHGLSGSSPRNWSPPNLIAIHTLLNLKASTDGCFMRLDENVRTCATVGHTRQLSWRLPDGSLKVPVDKCGLTWNQLANRCVGWNCESENSAEALNNVERKLWRTRPCHISNDATCDKSSTTRIVGAAKANSLVPRRDYVTELRANRWAPIFHS